MALEREYSYYQKNHSALVRRYKGKVLVIRGEEVVATYKSDREAYLAAKKKYPLGTFLIQKCSAGGKEISVQFHTPGLVKF